MDTANVNDPHSVEAIYPQAAFDEDVHRNAQDKATVHHGVTILSAPDAEGRFALVRANRHVGETDDTTHSLFVCPLLDQAEYGLFVQDDTDYGGPVESRDPPGGDEDPYRSFVAEVIRTARAAHFPPEAPTERLKGFRGG